VFPDANNRPTGRVKFPGDAQISLSVSRNLSGPVAFIRSGHSDMLRATVPKAAIYENGYFRDSMNKIGLPEYINWVQFNFATDVVHHFL